MPSITKVPSKRKSSIIIFRMAQEVSSEEIGPEIEFGQNILDQPPFTWVFSDPGIVPDDFFADVSDGRSLLMKIVSEDYHPEVGAFYKNKYVAKRLIALREKVNKKFHDDTTIYTIAGRIYSFLQDFPRALDYLRENAVYLEDLEEAESKYGRLPLETYAAFRLRKDQYQDHLNKADKIGRWVGLSEELPGKSDEESVIGSMPAKPPIKLGNPVRCIRSPP